MKNQRNSGITLIALVITIVVLVILVGVSVSVAINTGLIANSKKAVADYDTAQKDEEAQIQNVADLVAEYSGTAGKTIADLYDGINDPETANYDEDAMHIGDYVNYTAGTWSETIAAPTEETPFTFGGYTEGQSRDTNATGIYTNGETTYEGWRIWDISEDKKTITLISAGCPEGYFHFASTTGSGYNSEMILTGSTSGTPDSTLPSTPRDWSNYLNTAQYASSARTIKKSDLDTWYGKYIDSTISDSSYIDFPENTANKLISTVENGYHYYLATNYGSDILYTVLPGYDGDGNEDEAYTGYVDSLLCEFGGVRVLVTLNDNVKFEKSTEGITQNGFSYNKWLIK